MGATSLLGAVGPVDLGFLGQPVAETTDNRSLDLTVDERNGRRDFQVSRDEADGGAGVGVFRQFPTATTPEIRLVVNRHHRERGDPRLGVDFGELVPRQLRGIDHLQRDRRELPGECGSDLLANGALDPLLADQLGGAEVGKLAHAPQVVRIGQRVTQLACWPLKHLLDGELHVRCPRSVPDATPRTG